MRGHPVVGKIGCLYNLSVQAQWNTATIPNRDDCRISVYNSESDMDHDNSDIVISIVSAAPGISAQSALVM